MEPPRADGTILEFAGRLRSVSLIALAVLGLGAVGWALFRNDPGAARAEGPPLLGGDRVVVEVLNGSGRRGLARAATRALRQSGFDVVYFGTVADSVRTTQVLARRGDSSAAARVAKALGAGLARVRIDTLLRVDVSVVLGADYRPPAGFRP